jgi:DNA-binding MarR family transcriptional regulator
MEHEYHILAHLQRQELTTQRKIASRTGLSLGAVNLLLKKMVRKGLVKVEKLNPRTVRYILTPQGLREKTRLTYNYVRRSYRQIIEITGAVEELVRARQARGTISQVILFGPADELEQILTSCLRDMGLAYQVWRPDREPPPPQENQLVLTWRHEEEEKLPNSDRVVNIMKLI